MNTLPINGGAPYFRAAYELQWGKHILEIGTFGLISETSLPMATPGTGTNRFTDIGFDSQYQYQGDGYWITVRGTYLHENQRLDASFANGLAANPNNTLNTFRAQAALTYGVDGKIVLTGGYFNTWGSSDTLLYAGNRTFSPNSDGFTARDRLSVLRQEQRPEDMAVVQYQSRRAIHRLQQVQGASTNFDGMGTNARDNNTLLVYLWSAF